jgi:hypothetical protein
MDISAVTALEQANLGQFRLKLGMLRTMTIEPPRRLQG